MSMNDKLMVVSEIDKGGGCDKQCILTNFVKCLKLSTQPKRELGTHVSENVTRKWIYYVTHDKPT